MTRKIADASRVSTPASAASKKSRPSLHTQVCSQAPPRKAGGLMSWAASKAVGRGSRPRRVRASAFSFRIVQLLYPPLPARGCTGVPALARTRRSTPHNPGPESSRLKLRSSRTGAHLQLRSYASEIPPTPPGAWEESQYNMCTWSGMRCPSRIWHSCCRASA